MSQTGGSKEGSSKHSFSKKEVMGNPNIAHRKRKMGVQNSILHYFKRESSTQSSSSSPVKQANTPKEEEEPRRSPTQGTSVKKQCKDHEISSGESDEENTKPWKRRPHTSDDDSLEYNYTINDFESLDTDEDDIGAYKKPAKKPITSLARLRQTRKDPTERWRKLARQRGLQDTEEYRNHYPNKKDDLGKKQNLLFYTNKRASAPRGDYIDVIHKSWYGNYQQLESHHGYIQWLFPIRESGMNYHAQELQLHEAQAIREDPETYKRVLKSYKMMLHFYGMELTDEQTGEIRRGLNWAPRFRHLNRSSHNYLRITRILKSLGELGYEHLKPGWVLFLLKESLIETEEGRGAPLSQCENSCTNYWIGTLRDKEKRQQLCDYADDLMQQ